MTDVVLFGAGASYGAGGIVPDTPPLGNSLFPVLARHYPQSWGRLPQEVDSAFKAHFEQGMALLWDKYSPAVPQLMQHMTLFLAQFRPQGDEVCLYAKFAQWATEQGRIGGTVFSTLNYECLLELAFSAKKCPVSYFENAPRPSVATIWKLHGSCNFISDSVAANRSVSFTREVSFGGQMRAVNPSEAIQYCLGDNALYPAMALYMSPKIVQITSESIRQLQEVWKRQISTAERVLVIGVHPYPDDTHIWGPLSHTNASLAFVGAEEAFRVWTSEHRKKYISMYLGSSWRDSYDRTIEFLIG